MITQQIASPELNKVKPISPPKLPNLPLVGVLPFLSNYSHLELHKLAKQYGNVFQIRLGKRNLVVINQLETIKEALVTQQDIFSVRADFDTFMQYPQHELMELKSGEPWKRHRKMMGQAMHTYFAGKSNIMEDWIMEEAANLVNIFQKSNGKPFEPDLHLFVANSNFLHKIAFGKKDGTANFIALNDFLQKLPNGLLNTVKLEIMPHIWKPIFSIFRQKELQDFYNGIGNLINYVSDAVEKNRESLNPEDSQNYTDLLLKASSELTESDKNNLSLSERDIVHGTLVQFFGAGTELPSLTLRWALLYMISYPAIQEKIQKELDEVVGREQQVSINHRSKLPFTEACINEVFRHSCATVMPPITNGTASDTTLQHYFIPKGTPLLVNYYSLTRDERYWKEPEQFNPYRFLDEDGKLKNELLDKFYPFGMGARRCIGEYLGRLQIFTLFANLIHNCKLETVHSEKVSLKPQPGAFTKPKDYRVIVKSRF